MIELAASVKQYKGSKHIILDTISKKKRNSTRVEQQCQYKNFFLDLSNKTDIIVAKCNYKDKEDELLY